MVMQREAVPPPGASDLNTRSDELLQNMVAATEEWLAFIKRQPLTPDLLQDLESGGRVPVQTKTLPLDTARTDVEVPVQGIGLLAITDGLLTGCGVKLSQQTASLISFNDINPIPFPFSRIFLTTPAQAGKTLKLYYSEEVVPWASAYPVTIQASQSFNILRSDKDTHFTGALAQGAKEDENIAGLLANKIRVTGITLQADQRLHYKILLWFKDSFDDTDLDLDMFCAEIDIDLAAYGIQIGGAGQWYLDVRDLHVDYDDMDITKELHISLYNADPTAKNAGATGEVVVAVTYEPRA